MSQIEWFSLSPFQLKWYGCGAKLQLLAISTLKGVNSHLETDSDQE